MFSEKQKKFLMGNEALPTPFQVIDVDEVEAKYQSFRQMMPFAKIYYAVKSNPHDEVIKRLIKAGSHFDTASIEEINQVLSLGGTPMRLSYGSTIKKATAISEAMDKGVRLFALDCDMELEKIAKIAKEKNLTDVAIYARLLHDGTGSGFPLNAKFGAPTDEVIALLIKAKSLGLIARGVSFHVGSQAKKSVPWIHGLKETKKIFDEVKKAGLTLDLINLGGGFPSYYRQKSDVESLEKITKEIGDEIEKLFKGEKIDYLIEPGRGIIAEAAISVTEVILKSDKKEGGHWLYLDLGVYNGLFEAIDPVVQHEVMPLQPSSAKTIPMILAGPTCDSWDTLYSKSVYHLPEDLTAGDRLLFINTGSYSGSLASHNFNGFAPMKIYAI